MNKKKETIKTYCVVCGETTEHYKAQDDLLRNEEIVQTWYCFDCGHKFARIIQ